MRRDWGSKPLIPDTLHFWHLLPLFFFSLVQTSNVSTKCIGTYMTTPVYVYFMLNFFCYELWLIANLPISLIDYHCRYNPFSGLTSIHHLQCNTINTDTSGIIRVSVWSELFLEVIYELFHCWCKWDCPLYGCLY